MQNRTVIFSHGHISSPDSHKIQVLAPMAEERGFRTLAIDYRDLRDDPPGRVERLVEHIRGLDHEPVLAGSSMGGYVSVAAAEQVQVAGLFLMAPALFMEDYVPGQATRERYAPRTDSISVVHGWDDETIDWRRSIRFAEQIRARLHLLPADHRLEGALGAIGRLFADFLERM